MSLIILVVLFVVKKVFYEMIVYGDICNDEYYWMCDDECEDFEVFGYLEKENSYVEVVFKLLEK